MKQKYKKRRMKDYVGLLYISPFIIGFLIFQLYPFISSIIYSFTDFTMIKKPDFVGFSNYINMFTKDRDFWNSVKVTFKYVLMAVPMKLIFALFIAMVLNMKLKSINFFRTIYYLPSILGGSVAVAVMWRFLFMYDGLVNNFLGVFNIPPVSWLGNPDISLYTIGLLAVWQFGSSMVLFLAGLKQIPENLYEASAIDGASKVKQFFVITLPMLTPIILFNMVMQTISAFQEFTGAFVITNGGPMKSTYLYGMMLYDNAFVHFKMGYASAQSWILFFIIVTITAILLKSSKRWAYYEDGGDF
ncbi:carbohydrate ABC transporter permease [Vallitalea guaymasensis]|uniref:Sugar ABC transporter permease n=2 Tax=Vallitalea guaymasensis TaxID=1185412 RepID=A0A8J8M8J8_9FIRM|nr:sugar ABC transporter permease [Vallitalea guaymasensis]QUH28341.1 sugar ABC transporter permease [Vallitalea guaymasensis]